MQIPGIFNENRTYTTHKKSYLNQLIQADHLPKQEKPEKTYKMDHNE